MENKTLLELLDRFYAHGLLKEVYTSDTAIVCNVFNQYYVAFPLQVIKKLGCAEQFPGYIVNSKGLRSIVEEDNYINLHFQALSEEMKDKSLAVLDEKLFQHMLVHKDEFAQRPPKVDLRFEQEVIAKGKEAIKHSV